MFLCKKKGRSKLVLTMIPCTKKKERSILVLTMILCKKKGWSKLVSTMIKCTKKKGRLKPSRQWSCVKRREGQYWSWQWSRVQRRREDQNWSWQWSRVQRREDQNWYWQWSCVKRTEDQNWSWPSFCVQRRYPNKETEMSEAQSKLWQVLRYWFFLLMYRYENKQTLLFKYERLINF